MKNALTTTQGTAAGAQGRRPGAALRTFDADLRRRGAAERTRRAYGTDAAELAAWATANGLAPGRGRLHGAAPLGRRALSQRGAAPRTMARKLASIRSLFRSLLEHGEIAAEPGRPAAGAAAAARRSRRCSSRRTSPRCWTASPPSTPLEQRDRALFELAYACGLRAEELVDLDVDSIDFDAEQVRVEGKGSKTRFVPAGEPALRSLAAYLERAPAGACSGDDAEPALFLSKSGRRLSTSDVRRRLRVWAAPRRHADGRAPARAAPLLRHPPAGRRRGPARDPGTAGPCQHLDDAGLHSGRVRPTPGGVCEEPPAG